MFPSIKLECTNNEWKVVDQIEDLSVLYKKLTISNISLFVNDKDKYESIDEIFKIIRTKENSFKN